MRLASFRAFEWRSPTPAASDVRPAWLLDMEMDEATGFETVERLRHVSGSENSVFLALTGSADLRDAAQSDPLFAASMLKPADPRKLLVLLSKLVPEH